MKRKRTDYKTCEYCGASLDVGEKCDCKEKKPAPFIIVRRELKGGATA